LAALFFGHVESGPDKPFQSPDFVHYGKWLEFKMLPNVPEKITELWFWVTQYLNRKQLPFAGGMAEQPWPFQQAVQIADLTDSMCRKRKESFEKQYGRQH